VVVEAPAPAAGKEERGERRGGPRKPRTEKVEKA
jgi:hypothetical protein